MKNGTLDQGIEGFKGRKIPALVMWYLPVIDRLKCIFSNPRDAEMLIRHVNRKMDENIQHLADNRQWKQFDLAHQEDFSYDPKNIRFRLGTNGINTFREIRNPHST
jgi:hypothetical protein